MVKKNNNKWIKESKERTFLIHKSPDKIVLKIKEISLVHFLMLYVIMATVRKRILIKDCCKLYTWCFMR